MDSMCTHMDILGNHWSGTGTSHSPSFFVPKDSKHWKTINFSTFLCWAISKLIFYRQPNFIQFELASEQTWRQSVRWFAYSWFSVSSCRQRLWHWKWTERLDASYSIKATDRVLMFLCVWYHTKYPLRPAAGDVGGEEKLRIREELDRLISKKEPHEYTEKTSDLSMQYR